MKKIIIIALFLILTAGNAFSHDEGDLMLFIEPQIGFAMPEIGVKLQSGPHYKKSPDSYSFGFEYALKANIHYYISEVFGVNLGVGVSGFVAMLTAKYVDTYGYSSSDLYTFSGIYYTIPFGIRLSLDAFAAGAGLTYNIPFPVGSSAMGFAFDTFDDSNFKLINYLGWYGDIGFDLSGRQNRRGGFGMSLRVGGSFKDPIAKNSTQGISYNPFRQFTVSMVFQPSIQLASLPASGK